MSMSDGVEWCEGCKHFDDVDFRCSYWGGSCYGTVYCVVKFFKERQEDECID